MLTKADYGKMGLIYSAIPLLNVLFTYGFETAYFRFSTDKEKSSSIYATAAISLIVTTFIFSALLWLNTSALATFAGVPDYPELIRLSIIIISLDTLTTIPFAKLRQQGRPVKFATLKIVGILVNIGFTVFFLTYCPFAIKKNPDSWVKWFYDSTTNPVIYIVWANVLQSAVTLLLLSKELFAIKFQFNARLWKEMMIYSLPLIIAGMGGMFNETFDRLMLRWWVPGTEIFKEEQVGVYNACYKLSILISLFVQAFKMGAEPFFFNQARGQEPQKTYARVMKFFVITICIMFLAVSLYIPIWKHFIASKHWEGLKIVPILLLANMFLGIYYNLSIWYKLGKKTRAGATITIIGAGITLVINWLFIPHFGFMACAWATFACYGSMMVISFIWGQKEYRIPYAWKKLVAYMVIAVMIYGLHYLTNYFIVNVYISLAVATVLFLAYCAFIIRIEKKEFKKLPVIGSFLR